jgi:hypothetical protein
VNFFEEIAPEATLALSLVPVALLAILVRKSLRQWSRMVTTVLGLTLVHESVLIVFPLWYSYFTNYHLDRDIMVDEKALFQVYFGEAVFITLFAVSFIFLARRFSRGSAPDDSISPDSAVVRILMVFGVIMFVSQLLFESYTYDQFSRYYDVVIRSGWDLILNWVESFILWPALIAAGLVAANPNRSRLLRVLALIILVSYLLFAMVNGFRGRIVWVFTSLAAGAFLKGNRRLLTAAALVSIALVPLFPFFHANMRWAYWFSPVGTTPADMVPRLLEFRTEAGRDPNAEGISGFLETWAGRAEGPRNSVAMYDLAEGGRYAGYLPILGAVVLPVPRVIWPDKPVAGSITNENLGAAIYLVQRAKPHGWIGDMGPVLASAHAYWEGGWPWLVLAAAFTGVLWSALLRWGERSQSETTNIIILVFLCALPIDGFFSAINPVYTYVRLIWTTLIPLLLLKFSVAVVSGKRRTIAIDGEFAKRPRPVLTPYALSRQASRNRPIV